MPFSVCLDQNDEMVTFFFFFNPSETPFSEQLCVLDGDRMMLWTVLKRCVPTGAVCGWWGLRGQERTVSWSKVIGQVGTWESLAVHLL